MVTHESGTNLSYNGRFLLILLIYFHALYLKREPVTHSVLQWYFCAWWRTLKILTNRTFRLYSSAAGGDMQYQNRVWQHS